MLGGLVVPHISFARTVAIAQPSLPSPSGFAWLVSHLVQPNIYYHMDWTPFDHDGSGERPRIRVIWVNGNGDVKPMVFSEAKSKYLEEIKYDLVCISTHQHWLRLIFVPFFRGPNSLEI